MNIYKKVLKSLDEALNSTPVIENAADYKHVKSIDYHGKTYKSIYDGNFYYNDKEDILVYERFDELENCFTYELINTKIQKDPKFPKAEFDTIGFYYGTVSPFDDPKSWNNGTIELEVN